jgi:imidazolonepropionase-like amidohydrolase
MSRRLAVSALALSLAAAGAQAQDLTITNARIIVGDGRVIEKGAIAIRGGKITAVGTTAPAGGVRIDGAGFTVMPGFIDGHRHLVQGDPAAFFAGPAADRMRELLESGVTTVMSGGDNGPGIIELQKRIEAGTLKGPRIITSAQVPAGRMPNEEAVRAAVRAAKATGAQTVAEIIFPGMTFPNPPTEQETKNLTAAIDEGAKAGMPVQVHAVSPMAMMAAVRAGTKKLVHTPHFGWITEDEAKEVAQRGAQVASCTGFGAPVFNVYNRDNQPTFRDGRAWPGAILDGQGRGREAGYKPVNGRTLFDAGVPFGYCTDTTYYAPAALAHELRVLSLTFSPVDLVKVMGPNSATFVDRPDLGTLEVGKTGDLVVLTANPLEGVANFSTAVVVAKEGKVLVDKRAQLKTYRALPYQAPPLASSPMQQRPAGPPPTPPAR